MTDKIPDHECAECGLVGRPFYDIKRWYHYDPFKEVWLCYSCREPYFMARIRGVYPDRTPLEQPDAAASSGGQATLFDF